MPFDNTKYDLELSNIPLRIENYRKLEAETFIPRLGSGSQSESEFDLLKARSLESFSAGMLQRQWDNDNSYFGSESLYPIYDDGVLYPVKQLVGLQDIMGKAVVTARCQTSRALYLAINNYSGPTFNRLVRIDTTGAITNMTLPAAIASDPAQSITSMVIWNGQVWGATNSFVFYMPVTSTTAINITGGGGAPTLLTVWQGSLYCTGAGPGDVNVGLYKYTGDTTTRSFSLVGSVDSKVDDSLAALFVYNGRVIITRTDGMWAYDGIRLAPVDTAYANVSPRNYRFPAILKGYLHYFMDDGLYRYNGSMVEKLYDISEVGFPTDMTSAKNRLWISYTNSAFSGSSRYDKSMGYDYSGSSSSVDGRVMVYDGKAIFTYGRTVNDGKPTLPDLNRQGENDKIFWFNNTIYVSTYYSKTNPGIYFSASTDEINNTGTSSWRFITSIFDADFAMIDKSLENIEIVFDTDASADEVITVEYRTTGFSGNTGWTSLGTLSTQSKLKESIFTSNPAGIKFRKIQLRLSATTTLGYGIKKFILRYLLVPDFKWQWQFTINAFGDDELQPLLLKDGSHGQQKVSLIRGIVYSSRAAGTPVGFTDIDQLDLNGAHNDSVTTISLNTTELLKPFGFVKIDDEIIRYSSKTPTTLLGCQRAQLGTVAASHLNNAKVFAYYRALVRKISNERVEMQQPDNDLKEDSSKATQIAIILQEV